MTPLSSPLDSLAVSKRLSEVGLKVLPVGAGRQLKDSNFSEHEPAVEHKYRDTASKVFGNNPREVARPKGLPCLHGIQLRLVLQ